LEICEGSKRCQQVEALLVSTGVYNPDNDIEVQLGKLIETTSEFEKKKLAKKILGDNSSFVNYFVDKQNVPDKVVNNLGDAVEHILKTNI